MNNKRNGSAAPAPRPKVEVITPQDIWDAGWEIKQDGDYFRFGARFEVLDSGLLDTPEDAVQMCRKYLREQYADA